jgi:hypothetical protein
MSQGQATSLGSFPRLLSIHAREEPQTLLDQQKPRWWIAFVAGFLFVLQTLTVAWATSATPSAPQLDAFGNPLCITSTDHDRTAPAGDRSKLPQCCEFGCTATWTTVAGPAGDDIVFWRPLLGSDVFFRRHGVLRVAAPDHDPRSPRAPPLTA